MGNILPLSSAPTAAVAEQPWRGAIRRRSRWLASLLSVVLALLAGGASLLAAGVLFYDGPLLSFGPGGLWIGGGADAITRRVALSSFSASQRLAGALMVILLAASILFVVYNARALFRLYAAGIVFTPINARRIKRIGAGLMSTSISPFVANRVMLLAGVTNDAAWFHVEDALALVFGLLVFVVANVMEFGHELEQERDGFI